MRVMVAFNKICKKTAWENFVSLNLETEVQLVTKRVKLSVEKSLEIDGEGRQKKVKKLFCPWPHFFVNHKFAK